MKKVLITGGAGYIGSQTAHLLTRRGYDPVVVDNLSKGHRHNVDAKRLHVMDIAETDALAGLMESEGVQAVIHFAGFIAVGESTQRPELYFSNNVGGTLSLLTAMQRAGVSPAGLLVDRGGVRHAGTHPHHRGHALRSRQPLRRVQGDGGEDAAAGSINAAVCAASRCATSTPAAPTPRPAWARSTIPRRTSSRCCSGRSAPASPITLFGDDYPTPDGTCMRDYIHVADLAEAHVLALEALLAGGPSAAFNVGTGEGHSVLEVSPRGGRSDRPESALSDGTQTGG